jgi:hypothetical protein
MDFSFQALVRTVKGAFLNSDKYSTVVLLHSQELP